MQIITSMFYIKKRLFQINSKCEPHSTITKRGKKTVTKWATIKQSCARITNIFIYMLNHTDTGNKTPPFLKKKSVVASVALTPELAYRSEISQLIASESLL